MFLSNNVREIRNQDVGALPFLLVGYFRVIRRLGHRYIFQNAGTLDHRQLGRANSSSRNVRQCYFRHRSPELRIRTAFAKILENKITDQSTGKLILVRIRERPHIARNSFISRHIEVDNRQSPVPHSCITKDVMSHKARGDLDVR